MRKRVLPVLILVVIVAAIVFGIPTLRDIAIGGIRGEPFQDRLPLRYWVRTLRSGNDQEREQAAYKLGELRPVSEDVLIALADALSDPNYIVRRNAAESLGRIGPPAVETTTRVIATLKDPDARVRCAAARTLGLINPRRLEAVPALVPLAQKDPDVATQTTAIVSIGKLGAGFEAIEVLVDALGEPPRPDGDPGEAARGALEKIGPLAIPDLIVACEKGNVRGRANAARTLATMGNPARDALPALRKLLADKDASVRVHSAHALWILDGQAKDTVPVLVAVLQGTNRDARGDALVVLGQMGDKAAPAVDAIRDCLLDKNEDLRRTAAQTLAKIGRPAQDALPTLEKMAKEDKEADVRRAAADAVEKIK